jgi:beta-lactamase regulating signal transducer with metallopeptidase domain
VNGLLALRLDDHARFRTVVLHELAHVRNGDVTVAYVTVTVWRAFVPLVLLPYVAHRGTGWP